MRGPREVRPGAAPRQVLPPAHSTNEDSHPRTSEVTCPKPHSYAPVCGARQESNSNEEKPGEGFPRRKAAAPGHGGRPSPLGRILQPHRHIRERELSEESAGHCAAERPAASCPHRWGVAWWLHKHSNKE